MHKRGQVTRQGRSASKKARKSGRMMVRNQENKWGSKKAKIKAR